MSAFVLCALGAQAVPQDTAKRKIPCKTPENAALCYWTHGRLSAYNGDPSIRLWKIGTKRILGIYSGPSRYPPRTDADSELPEYPRNLDHAYEVAGITEPTPYPAYADFEVCPLEPERPGWMQAVCIESAKNIFIDKSRDHEQ